MKSLPTDTGQTVGSSALLKELGGFYCFEEPRSVLHQLVGLVVVDVLGFFSMAVAHAGVRVDL